MRLASGNAALTATSWGPIVKSCPEGPTRLDREIWVGAPARRADGSGRRTAGRWVAPPAVAAVRFSGLRVVERERSRARLGKATGVPRGADDPQGPIGREQAGSPAGHPVGALGGCRSQVRAILTGRPRQDRLPTKAGPAQQDPPYPVPAGHPLVLVPAEALVRSVGSRLGSQSLPVARQVPVLSSPTTVLSRRYGESWLTGSRPGGPAVAASRP